MGKYQSGQMGQTVNLLSFDFGGSNPSLPTFLRLERSLVFCGSSSVDRALAFQAEGRGFEPRLPLSRRGKSKGFPLFLFGSLHLFTFFWKDPSIIYWGDIRKRKEKKLYAVDGDTEDAIYVYDLPTP